MARPGYGGESADDGRQYHAHVRVARARGTRAIGNRVPPPAGTGPPPRPVPGGRKVPDPVSHPARTRPRASAHTWCAHQRRTRATPGPGSGASGRHPWRRLMPATQSASSPGTPPGDGDLDAVPRTRARMAAGNPGCPPGSSQREAPRPPGTGAATPRAGPVSGQGQSPARQHPEHRPRTQLDRAVAGAQAAQGRPADRAGKTGRSPRATAGAVAARMLTQPM
jgi:hypothetical protein